MKAFLAIFTLITLYPAPQTSDLQKFHFLKGIWKIENKENYEHWYIMQDHSHEGVSYKIASGEKLISENLSLTENEGKIIYTAKVKDQNSGQTVGFVWNKSLKDKFSFENLSHDFPKKIQYTIIDENTLFVAVLGEEDKGFSYRMTKNKP